MNEIVPEDWNYAISLGWSPLAFTVLCYARDIGPVPFAAGTKQALAFL